MESGVGAESARPPRLSYPARSQAFGLSLACRVVGDSNSRRTPMPSSRAELMLDPLALRELAFVARHADRLPEIAEVAAGVPEGSDLSAIVQRVSDTTGLESSEVERILLTLQSLIRLQARMHAKIEEVLDQITE